MKDFLSVVFSIFTVLFSIEAALYLYIREHRKGVSKQLRKKIKEYFVIYIGITAVLLGWIFFFEEQSCYLECQKDTMSCRYFHTTYFNKKSRLAGTYDISRVLYAKPQKHYRRRGASYYTVKLIEEENGFDLPPHHSYSGGAEKETARFNKFLRNDIKLYTFRKNPSSDSFGSVAGFMTCLLAIILETRLFWDLVVAAFKGRKSIKKAPQDDVIQRNR